MLKFHSWGLIVPNNGPLSYGIWGITNLFLACQWELPLYIGKYFRTKFTWKGYCFKPGQSSYCRVPVPVILGKEGEFPRVPTISFEHLALSNNFLVICQSPTYLTEKKKSPDTMHEILSRASHLKNTSISSGRSKDVTSSSGENASNLILKGRNEMSQRKFPARIHN